jgi:F-type H+-transporting ATPase subunit epsilon
MSPMRLEIITAERVLFEGDVDIVVAPGSEGEMGILPHHAALMTMLQAGELRYRIAGEETYLAITGGFMEVTGDQVTVLADAAERADEIDEARAQEAVRRAQERIAQRAEGIDLERALNSLRRAQVRVQTVTRRRVRRDQAGVPPNTRAQ